MLNVRVIPTLLVKEGRLVKGIGFKEYRYIGDPLNAVRIFNTKEVSELAVLDISATPEKRCISAELVRGISEECFMPLTAGGGISTLDQARELIGAGAEKVVVNTAAVVNPKLITEISETYGAQSVIVSIDVKKIAGAYKVVTHCGAKTTDLDPRSWAASAIENGAGEILLNSIDQEGSMQGYDLELLKMVSESVSVPVIAAGGAGKLQDFADAVTKGKATAVSAGSYFVFHGRRRAVLINFPTKSELERTFSS